MHVHLATILVVVAFVSAVVLLLHRGDRIVPVIAMIVAGIEALMVFDILSVSSGKFRIDVILPAALLLAMAASWSRAATKSTITAATAGVFVGVLQLVSALRLFD